MTAGTFCQMPIVLKMSTYCSKTVLRSLILQLKGDLYRQCQYSTCYDKHLIIKNQKYGLLLHFINEQKRSPGRKNLRAENTSEQKKPWGSKVLGAAKVSGQQRSQGSKGLRAAKVSGQQRSRGSKGLRAAKVSGQQRSRGNKDLGAGNVRGIKC